MVDMNVLREIVPTCRILDDLQNSLNNMLDKYEINTTNRIAGFLAQCGHETGDFNMLHENLNYSAKGLLSVFPRYFPNQAIASRYDRQPEKIANRIYANRMGNGPEESGDGYRYRGRGAIQITGHEMYNRLANDLGMSIDDTISYLETVDGAIESACWFWQFRDINSTCDNDDIVEMTKKINGGTIGLDDRKFRYEKAKGLL